MAVYWRTLSCTIWKPKILTYILHNFDCQSSRLVAFTLGFEFRVYAFHSRTYSKPPYFQRRKHAKTAYTKAHYHCHFQIQLIYEEICDTRFICASDLFVVRVSTPIPTTWCCIVSHKTEYTIFKKHVYVKRHDTVFNKKYKQYSIHIC